jgi:7-cyano-7-deazaguanine synthase in queuosine biosynthesis
VNLEVRPSESPPVHPDRRQVRWGDPGSPDSDIAATVDSTLSQLGEVSGRVIDLARLAAAAYVADRLSKRRAGFSRTIRVHVHLADVATWSPLLPRVERLLGWVSGDVWEVTASVDSAPRPEAEEQAELVSAEGNRNAVALLSGGLDSFSAAVLTTTRGFFVSHSDNPTVSGAQNSSWGWLAANGVDGERVRITLREADGKRENTTRTRAVLFYALAVALADARSVNRVEVPENGFTGLNLSLGNDRGGVLSTRSTHPWTMHLVQTLLDDAGIQIQLVNPYEWQTKGELVSAAAAASPTLAEGVATTLSCAKLDGRTYKGGNPNRNCGLCVACLTRRASIRAARIEDKTPYLATTLTGRALDQLRSRRDLDIRAVMTRVASNVDEFVLLENGPYPDDYDLPAAADLCRRGLAELAALLSEVV